MGNAISSAITDSWLASHERRVKKWLDNATEDSVLDALTSSFFPDARGYGGLPAVRAAGSYINETFSAYGSVDPVDNKRYWRETDLGLFFSNRFQGCELNASIPILWRCFHYHAYFPFLQKQERLDYGAFQRAIGLLAAEGNLRLGDNADGVTMDADRYPDANARASKQLWIMFKSLSIQFPPSSQPVSKEPGLSTTEEDLMDVLCLTQPDNPCIMPAPIEDLRPHAKRILSSSPPYDCSSIPRGDFLALLKLLSCIQMDKPNLSRSVNTAAHSLPAMDMDILNGIAYALLKNFTPNEKGNIYWHDFHNVISTYLPNFPFHFRHLFTTFLPPSSSKSQSLDVSSPKSILPPAYAQYLSLFLHPPVADRDHSHEEYSRLEALFALQSIQTIYSASPATFSATDLVAVVTPIKTGTLLLVIGDSINRDSASTHQPHHPPARVTFGACIPTPWDLQRQREYKANPAQGLHTYTPDHVLFQLEPKLEILLPDTDAWVMDLINITDSDAETGRKGGVRFGAEGGSGLSVDFDTGISTLRSVPITKENESEDIEKQGEQSHNQTQGCAYTDINAVEEGAEGLADEWETKMRIQRLEIYDLGGSVAKPFDEISAAVPRRSRLRSKELKPQINKGLEGSVLTPPEPQVGRDELRKRIEGFGSGG